MIYDGVDKCWYMLANKHEEMLGFYVIQFLEDDISKPVFLVKWKNKLNVGNANMAINEDEKGFRELIINYKVIYINTYNVMVLDLVKKNSCAVQKDNHDDLRVSFRHESV